MDNIFADLQTLSWADAAMRVGLAMFFGFCLGYERCQKNKPIDFRVYMIVAAMTCLVGIMGVEITARYMDASDNVAVDVLRIIEGVLTGIGFLGAGAILKSQNEERVVGTATGASIWGSGIMGLMLGFGLYGLALLGFGALFIILVLFGFLRKPLEGEPDANAKPPSR